MGLQFRADPIRSLAFGAISASYTALGSPLARASSMMHLVNTTDAFLMFSFTGGNDHIAVPANSFVLYDVTTNRENDNGWYLSVGTAPNIKYVGAAPTSGSVYLSIYFGASGN